MANDSIVSWGLGQIGNLDQYSFCAEVPPPEDGSFSICFWFFAKNIEGVQVIANHCHQAEGDAGWAIFIHQGTLVFRVRPDGSPCADVRYQMQDDHRWHHIVAMVDREKSVLRAYFDGVNEGWSPGECGSKLKSNLIAPKGQLIIGGYTDPAGGHFDHTFGRNGSGYVDGFAIYHRLLKHDEISQVAEVTKSRTKPEICIITKRKSQPGIVKFTAKATQTEASPIMHYLWDFGDGTTGEGNKITHTYAYGGTYQVALEAISESYGYAQTGINLEIPGSTKPVQITPVFVNETEGHRCYRIPSIIRAQNGDLIAFAEGRYESCSDSTKTIRLVSKRSTDNGKTWEPLRIIAQNIVEGEEYAIQNISPVVDRVCGTGRIVLVYNKVEFNEWQFAEGKGLSRCFCLYSDDHGLTWHDEKDITMMVNHPYNPDYAHIYPEAAKPENKEKDWRHQRPTIGHAIQLTGSDANPATKGRFFHAGIFMPGDAGNFNSFNYIFWSDDLGETWQIGGVNDGLRIDGQSTQGLNEATAVELENGDVLINSRNYIHKKPVGVRAVTLVHFDEEGNARFKPTTNDEALICPTVQASLVRLTHRSQTCYGGKSRILFSNPAHRKARYNLTIRLSYDEGQTWPVHKVIDPGTSSYSDLVIQEDMRIGVLYERGNQGGIYYANFPLDWLTDGKDRLE